MYSNGVSPCANVFTRGNISTRARARVTASTLVSPTVDAPTRAHDVSRALCVVRDRVVTVAHRRRASPPRIARVIVIVVVVTFAFSILRVLALSFERRAMTVDR
jgi:hypothetical protein